MITLTPEIAEDLIEKFDLENNDYNTNPAVIIATAAGVAMEFINLARERIIRNFAFGDSACKEEIPDEVFDEAEKSLFQILLENLPRVINFRWNERDDTNLRKVKHIEEIAKLIPEMTILCINWEDGNWKYGEIE